MRVDVYTRMVADDDNGLLPRLSEKDDYIQVFGRDELWEPAIKTICERHGISTHRLERAGLGTHVVFRSEGHIVKLFSPFWGESHAVELACLTGLSDLPVPRIDHVGALEGWPYLILSVVDGVPTRLVWHKLTDHEKKSVMVELGAFIRRLHDHPVIEGVPSFWRSFLEERISNLSDHHGLIGDWERWALSHVKPLVSRPQKSVVLNCDLTRDHVFVVRRNGEWRLSGVIDFGDAMIGHPYYEFTAPILDHAFGDSTLAAALMSGYGELLTERVKDELTRYFLVHLYWRLNELPANLLERSPEDYAAMVWGPIPR